ncbi:hypothetical protein TPA0910_29460 [Streptomyces hygroscopicus subsp. sporocinereus]|uniref:Uncharacterized protein n=1 Tax=Streptomyces hygroscopicus TaxID=1912 RepID=A0ABQ3TYY1_STRHY|nr:hypothetical protein TPA0910_29460 [Streptomyces hygroscopicus]
MVKLPQHGTYIGPLGHWLAVSRTMERMGPGMVPWNISRLPTYDNARPRWDAGPGAALEPNTRSTQPLGIMSPI